MLRTIARIAAWSLGTLATLLVLWFVANRTLDESLSPRAKMMLEYDPRIPDERNVAVGILGLTAPRGADFIKRGMEIKTAYGRSIAYPQIQNMVHGADALEPTVKGGQLNCWLDPDWPPFPDCLPWKEAPKVLQDNQELLRRYKALYSLDGYAASD